MATFVCIDASDGSVTFTVEIDDKLYNCNVTSEALQDIDSSKRDLSSKDLFDLHESWLDKVASDIINNGQDCPLITTETIKKYNK